MPGGGKPRPYGRQEERHTRAKRERLAAPGAGAALRSSGKQAAPLRRRHHGKKRGTQAETRLRQAGLCHALAEDVFYLVEEGGAALDGLVFDFDDAMELLEKGLLLLGQF